LILRSSGTVHASLLSGFAGGLYRRRINASMTLPLASRIGLYIFTLRDAPPLIEVSVTVTGAG